MPTSVTPRPKKNNTNNLKVRVYIEDTSAGVYKGDYKGLELAYNLTRRQINELLKNPRKQIKGVRLKDLSKKAKEDKALNERQYRVPRPFGATQLAIQYQRTKDIKDLNRLRRFIVQEYVTNNFVYCERPMSTTEFCLKTGLSKSVVRKAMLGSASRALALQPDGHPDPIHIRRLLWGILERLFGGSLQDRGRAEAQFNMLYAEQNGAYVPFLSSEVNKAMKNLFDSNANLASVIKQVMDINPKGNTVMGDPKEQGLPAQTSDGKLLTPEIAVGLLAEKGLLDLNFSQNTLDFLRKEHDLDHIPAVSAKSVGATDLDAPLANMNLDDELMDTKYDEILKKHRKPRDPEAGVIDILDDDLNPA